MTILRQKMHEDLQLAGLSANTQRTCLGVVKRLAEYYGKSPDKIGEEELRAYFLGLKNNPKVSRSTVNVSICGIKFFYRKTLKKEYRVFDLVRPRREKVLPVVLSPEEVGEILGCIRKQYYKTCLSTIYACGLRTSEGAHLRVEDIDSHEDGDPYSQWQRRERPVCAHASTHPGSPAAHVVDPPSPSLVVPYAGQEGS